MAGNHQLEYGESGHRHNWAEAHRKASEMVTVTTELCQTCWAVKEQIDTSLKPIAIFMRTGGIKGPVTRYEWMDSQGWVMHAT